MRRLRGLVAVALFLCAALSGGALAANPKFPGKDPNESVRINTPDDPDFDQCEPHLPGEGTQTCTGVFNQEFERFGFAPKATENTAVYKNPSDPHVARLMAQNTLAGRNPVGQVSGVSADRAWKFSIGDPTVQVGIVDTGIEWADSDVRTKAYLNAGELPQPLHDRATPISDGANCAAYAGADDANGDGAFDVLDFVCDSRVEKHAPGRHGDPNQIDAQDLIADPDFSDGVDDDGNGYVDDISGWDFFDDDNDAFDASSYSTADGHGSGRAGEAAARTNDAKGGTGVCPRCQYVPLRAWDSFVLDTNNFGQAVTYAADNQIEVIEGAVGGLYNTRFNREAFDYAYRKGVFFTIVSSDANTAAHNFPTVYNESLMIAGVVADQHGLSSDGADYPQEAIDFFGRFGIPIVPANAPVLTWFRNSGLTQYGGHAGIVMPATSGSEGTGQASGAAGLLISYGRRQAAVDPLFGGPLQPNEVKQLLTMTAEDVVPENTVGAGLPDPAQVGWDQHFGYGRPDLGLAMERIRERKIPPQALITSPDWFAPLNVVQQKTVEIRGRLSARTAAYTWQLQWAPGIEPCEAEFRDIGAATPAVAPVDGVLGTVDLEAVRAALDARKVATADPTCRRLPGPVQGGSTVDPTAPRPGPGDVDPNEPAFTVRVVVTAGTERGEHRKTLFAYRDATLKDGWGKGIGAGGEQSQRLYDLDGDNQLDVVQADSAGRLNVLEADGTPLPSFNGGQPVKTLPVANLHPDAPFAAVLEPPREILRTPVIGDIDGDMEPEIVDSAGEHVYAWNADGSTVTGFPVRLDPDKSRPEDRTKQNHVKRGFHASPSLGDFDGNGRLDITVPGMDQHLYAWDGSGNPMPGFPRKLKKPGETNAQVAGAEAVTTASVGDIAGDAKPEIVTPTNELSPEPLHEEIPLEPAANRIYAVTGTGQFVPGWPAEPSGQLPGIIPFFGPSTENAMGDLDGDKKLDTVGVVTSGNAQAYGGNGQSKVEYLPEPVASTETTSRSYIVNTFEYSTVANLNGGGSLEVLRGGVSIEGVANLLLVGQNLPYNHVMQAWDGATGNPVPGWPQVVEDYQWGSNPAVADVSDAPGLEVLAPTGLYTVRNLNAQGIEGTGWPKFTGGWNMATPSVGDADGDGKLDVAQISREGFTFLWKTDRPACGTNDEWWTSRHDEFNSGAYGTDSRPPGTPRGLKAARSGTNVSLSWTAPGGNWLCGSAARYRIVSSDSPITHPAEGTVVGTYTTTDSAGDAEARTLTDIASGRHVAVLYQDAAGNWGHLASVFTGTLAAADPAPTCADVGPVPVDREQGEVVELVCADPDGDPLTITITDPPDHGTLSDYEAETGRITYTPDDGYTGPDSFSYQAGDGTSTSPIATVTLQVAPAANRAPACEDIGPSAVAHGKPLQLKLRCTDPDGDTLSLSVVDGPAKGRLGTIDQAERTITYTPDAGAEGADEFTYRANDAQADSPPAKVRLEIAAASATVTPAETATPAPSPRPTAVPGPRPTATPGCVDSDALISGSATPSRRGLRLAFSRRIDAPVQVDVFQHSVGRRVIGERLIARFPGRRGAFTWNGVANRPGRVVADGTYSIRFLLREPNGQTDVRRVVMRRSGGAFRSAGRAFERPTSCDAVRFYKLTRPVFGGSTQRPLTISYRLNRPAKVTITVLRGNRVVRRLPAARRPGGRTFRVSQGVRGLRRGDYRFRITATAGRSTVTATLASRLL